MPPRRNYNFEKRQKDQARKDKQAEKLQRKRDRAAEGRDELVLGGVDEFGNPTDAPASQTGTPDEGGPATGQG